MPKSWEGMPFEQLLSMYRLQQQFEKKIHAQSQDEIDSRKHAIIQPATPKHTYENLLTYIFVDIMDVY